jgi:hypothetical protein
MLHRPNNYPLMSRAAIHVSDRETGLEFYCTGKIAAMVRLLMLAGADGVTKGEAVGPLGGLCPNIGGMICRLKAKGLQINSEMVLVGPRLRVANYRLDSDLEMLRDEANG